MILKFIFSRLISIILFVSSLTHSSNSREIDFDNDQNFDNSSNNSTNTLRSEGYIGAAKYKGQNPEEVGKYIEGDIVDFERNGITGEIYRWPKGIVPYVIEGNFTVGERKMIQSVMKEFKKRTCVRFQPRTPKDKSYIVLLNNSTGCFSHAGRRGGRQEVNLESKICFHKIGTPMHELLHALGFLHEQNRYERDSYVLIYYKNILPGTEVNFKKATEKDVYAYGVPYDFKSVLHYKSYSNSKNGRPTIVALRNAHMNKFMGQRDGFSNGDLAKVNAMYPCKL